MIVKVETLGTVESFKNTLVEVSEQQEVRGVFILSCDENEFTPEMLDESLKKVSIPLFGGIFPEIIHETKKLKRGTIFIGLSTIPKVYVIPGLSQSDEYDDVIDETIAEVENTETMVVLVDGLSTRIASFIEGLFNVFGLNFNYIGGGAGSLSFIQKPCLMTNKGLIEDCAVIALLENRSGIGVKHGWKTVSGPYRVTRSSRNVIETLDEIPAFDLYKKVVEEHSGKVFTDDNFFDLAKCYPFGIKKLGEEVLVRDPLMLGEDGTLTCVGEVPYESYVDILTGDAQSLVSAAREAKVIANKDYKSASDPELTLIVDCISRVLFLEDRFAEEIEALHDENTPMVGILTLGEIANTGEDYLEFYNKTTVACVLS